MLSALRMPGPAAHPLPTPSAACFLFSIEAITHPARPESSRRFWTCSSMPVPTSPGSTTIPAAKASAKESLQKDFEPNSPYFSHGEYLDEILLDGLDKKVAAVNGDELFVFHVMGSHGPAYYRRYPSQSARFKPACPVNQSHHTNATTPP